MDLSYARKSDFNSKFTIVTQVQVNVVKNHLKRGEVQRATARDIRAVKTHCYKLILSHFHTVIACIVFSAT